MDGLLYPVSIIVLAMLAFSFYRTQNNILALIILLVGVYIIYSHETGNTATSFKNKIIESVDGSAKDFSSSHGTAGYDESKSAELLDKKEE